MKRTVLLIPFLLMLARGVAAQVATGTPPFSSIGGGPFDAVNLGNVNVHFAAPIIHKAGRGMSFDYDLSYDSSIWSPVGVSGSQTWQPVADNWGWQGQTEAATGYIPAPSKTQGSCSYFDGTFRTTEYYYKYVYSGYRDKFGVFHGAPGLIVYDPAPDCGPQTTDITKTAFDGSGLTITVGALLPSGTVTSRSGVVYVVPVSNTSGTANVHDANGNQITVNTNQFFDTLSGTTPVLTIAGSGTSTSPLTFTYTGPTGNKSYTVHYTAYGVKTNFLCSGVSEYTSTSSVPLITSIVLPDSSQYSFQYEDTPGNAGYKTGRISQVTLPTGGVISYSYTGANDGISCADGSTLGLTRSLSPGGTWQYTRSGSGTAWTTTVTDPSSNQTAINFEEYSSNFYETQRIAYQGSTSGTVVSTTINCYNGQSVATPANCFNTPITAQITRVTSFRYLPNTAGLQSETDSTYDTFGLINEVDEYDYGVATVGTLIRKTITGYTAGLGNGIVDRPSSVKVEDASNAVKAYTAYGYDESSLATPSGTTPQWTSVSGSHGNLTTVTVQASGSTYLYRKYTYYNTGMLSTSTDVSASSTVNGGLTSYTYSNSNNADCGNAFVTSISEPVASMSRSFTWDCNGGVLLSVTDENGQVSSTAYSGASYTNVFWRPYSTTDEALTTTNYFYRLTSSTPPVEFQTESVYAQAFNSGNSILDTVITNDGFGRTVFSQKKRGPSATYYDTTATCYDNFGRVSLTTLPYSTSLATSTTACPSTNPGASTAYYDDALGRTQKVSDSSGGSTTYSYNESDTTETRSSPTVSKQSEFDALGRLTSVCEITAGTTSWPSAACNPPQNTAATGYLTQYGYDVLGNLTSVIQNAQASVNKQSRTYAYDMLGRLTSESNPETKNAAVRYSYDALFSDSACGTVGYAGDLLKRLDAAGNATCYSGYDALHRVGNITYPSSSTPSKYFVYDAATVNGNNMSNAKTRLAEAYTCIGGCSSKTTDLGFSYWPTGQTTDVWELTPHSGTNYYYHVTATPWPNGAVNTISNLVGLPTITYGANGEGRMSTVSASSGQNPVTSVTYDPAGHVTALTYGSTDSDSFTFEPKTGRMSQYQFKMGSTPLTDTGVISWNTNGSLLKLVVTDQINTADSQTCNYTHDDLGRVATANCGTSTFNQAFTFDPFGNITKTVPTGSTGTAFQPNYDYTTNRMSSTPFTYNGNNGALTADSSHGYGWDNENRVNAIDSGSSTGVCITYDALDRVVEQATGSSCSSSFKEIVYGPAGAKLALMNSATLTKAFVALPGGAQAVYNSSGLQYYRHPDWLGSSRLATTPSRTCYSDVAYAPFGENYVPASNCVAQDLNFTGQNQDTKSSAGGGAGGLYDFMFRKHSPVQGRWLSPDPAGLAAATPSDPQTWNRYTYVGNRPLNTTDALGLDGGCVDEEDCCDPLDPFCCDPIFGCDPCPDCGGGGGGGGGGGDGSPQPPQRHGGVWPNNETIGLPGGLNTSPLMDIADLLSLMSPCSPGPGIPGPTIFGISISDPNVDPNTGQRKVPCLVTLTIPLILVATSNSSSDKKLDCTDTVSHTDKDDRLKVCDWYNKGTSVQAFHCVGKKDCCIEKFDAFRAQCRAMGKYGQFDAWIIFG